jgi:nuclear pore complex protein Nup54
MWAEAMSKLEGMDSTERERLWPQLVQGFKDLSQRLKLQDEVLVSDRDRIKTTQSNVKMLQRHLQASTFPSIERLRQKEQSLQRRMLRVREVIALKDLTFLYESRLRSKLHLLLCSGLCA